MIQELLGEATAGLIGPERSKFSVPAGVSPSPPSSSSTTTTAPTSSSSTSENLRCPRCDSTNTKFCYYNNYNLTQPRHFCKTCRRYWTKGGALRNVPIGGGCRKNKSTGSGLTSSSLSSAANYNKSSNNNNNTVAKLKTTISAELGRSSFISSNFMDHELISSNPILFASPQNSHLLSLLRTNSSNPSPNPNPTALSNSTTIKDEPVLLQSHLSSGPPPAAVNLNARIVGLDPLGPFPSLWRSSNQQQNGGVVGELQQSSGILDFYQRLRLSTTSNYYQDNAPPAAAVSSSSSSSTILESAPVVGGATELGFWSNPVLSWSDLPTTHGAYP